jgi:hypothetical protein
MDPVRLHHGYGGVEHVQAVFIDDCLLCKLEAVAAAWFGWDQQALDALLSEYRRDDE